MDKRPPIVLLGCHVEIDLVDRAGAGERLAFDIVPDSAADFASGFLGESTPLAKVLLGEREGSVIPYLKDDIFAVRIVAVTPSGSKPPGDAKKKREARLKKAIHEVEHTNAIVFASSFSGKWGDYDPDSLPRDEETEDEDKLG
jgi:hypothetical protein